MDSSVGRADRSARLQPMRVPKMAELIAEQIRRQIVRGELKEGDALPSESDLLDRFHVSRPTLREAFRVLESESLIIVRRGAHGGARVQVPDIDVAARYAGFILEHRGTSLDDVYQARILIEPPVVGHLALHRTAQDVAMLRAALDEHDVVGGDPLNAIRAHTSFHTLLVDLAGNQTLRVLTGMIQHIIELANWEWVQLSLATTTDVEGKMKLGQRAHSRVIDRIEEGNRAGAEDLWRRHLTETRAILVRPDVTTVLDLMS